MDNKHSDMMKPAKYPDTYYYGIQPTICSIVAEMDDMSVPYPTQAMHEAIVDRVYDQVSRMYPDELQGQAIKSLEQNTNNPGYHAEQVFSPFRRRPIIRDLLAVLILSELLRRRRFFW